MIYEPQIVVTRRAGDEHDQERWEVHYLTVRYRAMSEVDARFISSMPSVISGRPIDECEGG